MLKKVYYGGTEKEWEKVVIGGNNNPLLLAEIIYNEIKPGIMSFEKAFEGSYTYVDESGKELVRKA